MLMSGTGNICDMQGDTKMSAVMQWLRLTAACPTANDAPARYSSRRSGRHRKHKKQRVMDEPHSQHSPAAGHVTQQSCIDQHEGQQPDLKEQRAQQAQQADTGVLGAQRPSLNEQHAQQAQQAAQTLNAQQADNADHQLEHNTHWSVPAQLPDQDLQDEGQLGAASTGMGTLLQHSQPGASSVELDAGLRQTAQPQQLPPTRLSPTATMSAASAVTAASTAPPASSVAATVLAAEPDGSSLPVQTRLSPQQEFLFMDMLSQLRAVMFEDIATDFVEDLPAAGKHLVALTFVPVLTCTCDGEGCPACQSVQTLVTVVLYMSRD